MKVNYTIKDPINKLENSYWWTSNLSNQDKEVFILVNLFLSQIQAYIIESD